MDLLLSLAAAADVALPTASQLAWQDKLPNRVGVGGAPRPTQLPLRLSRRGGGYECKKPDLFPEWRD